MTTRHRYLVCYDIREDTRLRRVHTVMKGWGDAIQYSVFLCELNRSEYIEMRLELRELINLMEDSVMVVDLGNPRNQHAPGFEFIGVPPRITTGGPRIV